MPDIGPKRIAEFIEPFRVEPGRRVRLPHDFDPAGTRKVKTAEAKRILAQGVGLLAELQMRLAAQDTYGVVVVLQAMDAAGKDGTIRHVMSGVNPQGVEVHSFKVPSHDRPRSRLPVALCPPAARARTHRHLQPLVLRRGSRRPCPSPDPRPPEAARPLQAARHLGAPVPRDQRLGALPDRPGLPDRQAVPQPLEGGAASPVPVPDRRTREELEVQRQRCQGAGLLGRLPEGVQRRPVEDEHRLGAVVRHPGRRQAVRPGRRRGRAGQRADRDRPALPAGRQRRPSGAPACEERSRAGGAQGR